MTRSLVSFATFGSSKMLSWSIGFRQVFPASLPSVARLGSERFVALGRALFTTRLALPSVLAERVNHALQIILKADGEELGRQRAAGRL